MKQIDKKDLPKLIFLVVLAVAVFAYAGVTIFTPTTTVAATRPAATQATTEATVGQAVIAEPAAAVLAMPSIGKDPFIPNGPASVETDITERRPAPAVAAAPQVPSLPPAGGRGMLGGPPSWAGPEPNYTPAPAPVELPPAPDYTVTGIVRGETTVAILRGGSGGDERRFVRVGDPVGNGFIVAAIQANGVEIKSGDRRLLLKLGDISRAK